MTAVLVSLSSINPTFGGEYLNDENDENTTPPSPTNAGYSSPRSTMDRMATETPADEGVPSSRYSFEEDEEEESFLPSFANPTSPQTTMPNALVEPTTTNEQDVDDDSLVSLNNMDTNVDDLPPMDDEQTAATELLLDMDDDEPGCPATEHESNVNKSQEVLGGLMNMGNTCYLNSALQMIASLDGFKQELEEHEPEHEESALRRSLLDVLQRLERGETFAPDHFKSKMDERSSLFIGFRQQDAHEFLSTMLDLLDEDYKKKLVAEDDEMQEAVSEEDGQEDADNHVQSSLSSPLKRQRIDNTVLVSRPSLQSTSSFKDLEFDDIENLLHGEKSEQITSGSSTGKGEGPKCKLIGGRMNTSGVDLTRWEQSRDAKESTVPSDSKAKASAPQSEVETKPVSPIDDYFTTEVRVCLTCDSCKYRRSHTETYLHLSLQIGPNLGTIEEGIRAFFKTEKRGIKCEKCFWETASQTTEITQLPRAMLFNFKRFIVDVSMDYTSISYRKDQSPVQIEPELVLNDQVLSEVVARDEIVLPKNARYVLRSVVNHIGSSASCGHYTADAHRLCSGDRQWLRFNDSYVSKISQQAAVDDAASTAYMVMYELEHDVHPTFSL